MEEYIMRKIKNSLEVESKKLFFFCLLILLTFIASDLFFAQELERPQDEMSEKQWTTVIHRAEKRLNEIEKEKEKPVTRKSHQLSIKQTTQNSSPLIFTEEPMVQILTGDKMAGFDETDAPGFDTSDVNDRVRSYDRIFYSFKLSLGSNDGQDYQDIKLKISGEVEGAFSIKTDNLNASIPASYGGTVDRKNKKIEFEQVYDKTGAAGIKTGAIRQFTIPVTVFGARNETGLSLKNFKIDILSAKKNDGTVIKLAQEKSITGMRPTYVSSKPNVTVDLKNSWSDPYLPYEYFTRKKGPYNIRQMGIGLTLAELPGRVLSEAYKKESRFNRFLGVEMPEDKIEIILGQEAVLTEPNQPTKDLMIEPAFDKTTVYDYGDIGSGRYPDHFNHGYINPARHSLYTPKSRIKWDETSVFDSGEQNLSNEANGQTRVTFENYKVYPFSVPVRPAASNHGSQVLYNYYFFATVGVYLKEHIGFLNPKNTITYRTKVLSLKIADDNQTTIPITKSIVFSRKTSTSGSNGVVTYTKYLDENKIDSLDNNGNGISPSGKGIITSGSEFYARSSIENASTFWGEESIVLQKWNPEESIFISAAVEKDIKAFYPEGVIKYKNIQYGVSRQKKYDIATLNKNRLEEYVWFTNSTEAQKTGEISAVQAGSYGKRQGNVYEKLNVRRRLKEDVLGATTPQGNPLATVSWGKIYWEIGDESKTGQQPSATTVYVPTQYGEDDSVKTHSSIFGDTLLVLPARVKIRQSLNVNVNEGASFKSSDKAKVTLTPEMTTSNVKSTYEGELTMTYQLPKGMNYTDGSAKYGQQEFPPTIKKLSNGETLLSWKIKHKVNQAMPKLTFENSFIQSDLSFRADGLTLIKTVATIEHQGLNSDISLRQAISEFGVMREDKWKIDDQVEPKKLLPGLNQEVSLKVKVSNQLKDALENLNLLDVLPQNGDDIGSKLSDDYFIKGIKILKNDQKTPDNQAKIYHTNEVIDRKKSPNSIASNLNSWTAYNQQKVQTKALFIQLPKLEPSQSSYITIDLELKATAVGDKMRSVITGNSPFFEGQVISQIQEVNWDYPNVTMNLKRKLKNKNNILEPLYNLENPDVEIPDQIETVKRQENQTFAKFIENYTKNNISGYDYQGYQVKVGDQIYENNLDKIPVADFEVTLLYTGQIQLETSRKLTFESQHVPKAEKIGIPLVKEETRPQIVVTNTQGSDSQWRLVLQEETKLKKGEKELIGELVYRKSKSAPKQYLNKGWIPIASSEDNSDLITTIDLLTTEEKGSGLFLDLKTGNLIGDYQGKLNWSLLDGPVTH